MRERPEQILKYVCWGLGALVCVQIIRAVFLANPLAHVAVPALPTLAEAAPGANHSTNVMHKSEHRPPVRRISGGVESSAGSTNKLKSKPQHTGSETGAPAAKLALIPTNAVEKAGKAAETNLTLKTTNSASHHGSVGAAPHVSTTNPGSVHHPSMPPVALAHAMVLRSPGKNAPLPPEIQASVERITDSEILGPIIHPLPMALLGIAGNVVFLRAPNGQTGLVKEGDELGGIKLLKIGINRVLIEQAGKKKELTIFAGMGGESLLDKSSESSHEINTR